MNHSYCIGEAFFKESYEKILLSLQPQSHNRPQECSLSVTVLFCALGS